MKNEPTLTEIVMNSWKGPLFDDSSPERKAEIAAIAKKLKKDASEGGSGSYELKPRHRPFEYTP